MLLRSSSSPLLNSSLNNPLKEGNEPDLNVAIRRCKSLQLSSASHQLHIAEDCHGNWFGARSDANPRNLWPRRWCRARTHGPKHGELVSGNNGRLDESLEEITEDCGSEIRAGRNPMANEESQLQSSDSGVAMACEKPEQELCPMYIAGGFGFGDGGGPSGGGGYGGRGGSSGSDSNSTDAYYQRMLEANPGHPLLLRNYARFLHEVLRDYPKAEEYYGRAILASPGDGDVLSLYAKLIWDLHRDARRAEAYFDQAVQAAPDDCYVLGSYAHFLWNAEDEEEEEENGDSLQQNLIPPALPPRPFEFISGM